MFIFIRICFFIINFFEIGMGFVYFYVLIKIKYIYVKYVCGICLLFIKLYVVKIF